MSGLMKNRSQPAEHASCVPLDYRAKITSFTWSSALNSRSKGFSVMELLIVVAIMLVLATLALPQLSRVGAVYKLDASGHAVASLLQQARLQAVKTNLPAYTQYDTTQTPNMVYVNSDSTQAFVVGTNPDVQLGSGITFQTAGVDHSQIDAYLGAGVTVEPTKNNIRVIGFNARGLPCIPTGNAQVCSTNDGGSVPAFLWLMQGNAGWEAVSVTPAGRVKSWRLTNAGAGANASCGYAACWQ
jgi:prepilin-type N-terminal cleavage/methylation domain-containing protein